MCIFIWATKQVWYYYHYVKNELYDVHLVEVHTIQYIHTVHSHNVHIS